jgi:hypothetical protein
VNSNKVQNIKYYFLVLILVLGASSLAAAAEAGRDVVAGSFTNFAARFPAAFWQAGDAYSRSLKLGGQAVDLKSFTNDNQAVVLGVKAVGAKKGEWSGSLKLWDKNEPEDYWTFEFRYRDGLWRTGTGVKHMGKSKLDLYAQQLGATSMRPFVEKEIEKIQKKD